MLVLTRKKSQTIQIGDDITIMVVKISKDNVRIGIQAPDNMMIVRPDLHGYIPGTPIRRKKAME